jgi:hypothetical protein
VVLFKVKTMLQIEDATRRKYLIEKRVSTHPLHHLPQWSLSTFAQRLYFTLVLLHLGADQCRIERLRFFCSVLGIDYRWTKFLQGRMYQSSADGLISKGIGGISAIALYT